MVWGARFPFNCYMHRVHTLVHYPGEVEIEYLFIIEGVTQGGVLSMMLYGMGLSVWVVQICGDYFGFIQSKYDDYFSMVGTGTHLEPGIVSIEALGTTLGLFFKLGKS